MPQRRLPWAALCVVLLAGASARGAPAEPAVAGSWVGSWMSSQQIPEPANALPQEDPDRLLPAFDCGDHLHPSPAGYRAMAAAIPLRLCAGRSRGRR